MPLSKINNHYTARPHQPGFAFSDQAIGIAVYMTICISVNAFVFYAASCVFVSPKNLLALFRVAKGQQTYATWFTLFSCFEHCYFFTFRL